ncbi:hypothetical protein ACWDOP_24015 [Nocardia sp. NPDC003693]
MFGKPTRRSLLVALPLLAIAVGAGAIAYLRQEPAPTAVALVNSDTGPMGQRIAIALQDGGAREWEVVPEASTADYAAVITLPPDLSTAVTSLATDKPQRAQVTVTTHEDADPALVTDAVNEVTRRITATGLDTVFAAMNAARGSVTQVALTTQMLDMGVQAAAAGAEQFSSGADDMLGFLEQAKAGAGQLTSAIATLNDTVSAATTQANQLAAALDSTGVTVGQVSGAADQLSGGIDTVVPLLQALPFAGDPRLANVIGQLQGLQTVAGQAGAQLSGVGELVGAEVTPETSLGQLLRDAATRLGEASAQLNQGGSLAASIPQLADEGSAQLQGALQALTAGVTQLQAVTTTLGKQANQALSALPQRGVAQQSAIATALTDPVDIVRD